MTTANQNIARDVREKMDAFIEAVNDAREKGMRVDYCIRDDIMDRRYVDKESQRLLIASGKVEFYMEIKP